MTVTYPTWWLGGRWDNERLIRDLFMHTDNVAAQGLSGVRVEPYLTRLDDREAWLEAGNALILVHRMGGHVNRTSQQWADVSITRIGAATQSRDQSNDLMAYVTDVLCAFDEGGLVHRAAPHRGGLATTFMTVAGEVVGPQLLPEQIGDDRLVDTTWEIHTDRPRGLPDPRDALGINW